MQKDIFSFLSAKDLLPIKQNLFTLFDSVYDAILYTDSNDKILYSNSSFSTLTGLDRDKIKDQSFNEIFQLLPLKEKEGSINASPLHKKGEFLLLKINNGEKRWVECNKVKVSDDKFTKEGFIYFFRDFSELKKTESALEQKNKDLNTFIYKVSHDLKGPLTSVIGLIHIAKEESNDQNVLNYLDLIEKCTQRLDVVLIDLLEVTRLEIGQVEVSTFDTYELIQEVIEKIGETEDLAGFEFRIEVANDFKINNDRNLIYFILRNLIINGFKYRKRNIGNPFVVIEVTSSDKNTIIKITDNGLGVEKELHERIFEMFYRASPFSKGSGLGLYIVKTAVNKLNGSFEINSTPNEGTSIKILLPKF